VGVNSSNFSRFPDVEKGSLYCAGTEKGTIVRCGVVAGGSRIKGTFKRIRPYYIDYHFPDVD
jgi:hypothetical protein